MSVLVVVPLKPLAIAKSRLRAELDSVDELALAFALDTVHAALAASRVARVRVVTDDPDAGAALSAAGAGIRPDPGGGLDAAALAGVAGERGPVAVLLGDLPALTAADLDDALGRASEHPRALVADTAGTGTTLLVAASADALAPAFGTGSRRRHEASGAVVVDAAAGVRADVDTTADLAHALRLGVGPATARVVSARSWGAPADPD